MTEKMEQAEQLLGRALDEIEETLLERYIDPDEVEATHIPKALDCAIEGARLLGELKARREWVERAIENEQEYLSHKKDKLNDLLFYEPRYKDLACLADMAIEYAETGSYEMEREKRGLD